LTYANEEAAEVGKYLTSRGISQSDYVVICPGASVSSKCWSDRKFIELKKAIEEKYNLPVVWSFPPGAVPQSYDGEKNIFAYSLNYLMPLLAHAKLYVGLDSGVGHIAASFGLPSVILFGPVAPELSKPLNDNLGIVTVKEISCRPCRLKKCPKGKSCMDLITVEDVLTTVEKLLAKEMNRVRYNGQTK
jgi:ADP-heptose:LPS heptosyltransferase